MIFRANMLLLPTRFSLEIPCWYKGLLYGGSLGRTGNFWAYGVGLLRWTCPSGGFPEPRAAFIARWHSILYQRPKHSLSVTSFVRPGRILTNARAALYLPEALKLA